MTRFDSWYASTIAQQLEETLKAMPKPTWEPIRKASRESMAACWNASLDAAEAYCDEGLEHIPSLDKLRATP